MPLDASVVLLFSSDVDGGAGGACGQMARRAMATGGRAVNFVVTGYYRADGDGRMTDLGYKVGERDRALQPYTFEAAYAFSAGLAECMRLVAASGFGLAVHIHLDDADDAGTWRNALVFEPFTRYGPLSYWEALVRPAAQAVRDANVNKAPVYFSMQAEMGATLFYHAASYRSMVPRVKAAVAEGGTPAAAVRVGVNINWEKVCGCPGGLMPSSNYFSELQARWPEVRRSLSVWDVQALLRAVDWIGVSAYAPLPEAPAARDLDGSLRRADRELRLFGVDLRSLRKELVYSEFGIGGGQSADYQSPARSPRAAAAAPFWGVNGRYAPGRDPWVAPDMRAFRRHFYDAALVFAAAGGSPDFKVSAIFLWGIISFDVTGVHYLSTSPAGSYGDANITAAIRAHNAAAAPQLAGGAPAPGQA